jgi:hypothetical protein
MNWKIILQLSIFGLIMAFATVSLIPEKIEWVFWLLIFIFCAYVIAKVCPEKYFLYGFLVSMVNCVWITAAHILWYKTYSANHFDSASKIANMLPASIATHRRTSMALVGPVFGAMFGIILGLFAFVASKIVNRK